VARNIGEHEVAHRVGLEGNQFTLKEPLRRPHFGATFLLNSYEETHGLIRNAPLHQIDAFPHEGASQEF
jgi:hypothetical protein